MNKAIKRACVYVATSSHISQSVYSGINYYFSTYVKYMYCLTVCIQPIFLPSTDPCSINLEENAYKLVDAYTGKYYLCKDKHIKVYKVNNSWFLVLPIPFVLLLYLSHMHAQTDATCSISFI